MNSFDRRVDARDDVVIALAYDVRSEATGATVARGFRGDIQGLRTVAVGAVVLYHAGVPFLSGGYIGVDIFFVISGFLITSHLLDGFRREGRVSFASFYAKRARRILPASFTVIALSVVAALIWYPPLLFKEVWQGAVATALYVPNYLFAVQGTDYLAEATPSLFQHYWSLGIEEQFYLLWPALLAVGFITAKRRRYIFLLVCVVVVASFALCVLLTFRSQPWAFFSLPTRAWELGVGGLVAFLLAYRPGLLRPVAASIIGWVGIAGVIACVVLFDEDTPFPGYWAAAPVLATAAIIVAGASNTRFGPAGVLSTSPMLFLGAISYSLYLVHWPMLQIPQAAVGFNNPLPLWLTLLLAVLCVPLSWVMYRFIENPARESRWLIGARPRRTLIASGLVSVLLAVGSTGAYAASSLRPLNAEELVAPTVISSPPVATAIVPANLTPSLRAVSGDQPELYDDGCHRDFGDTDANGCLFGDPAAPRIVLFGDSHAAQWFPAVRSFAESRGYAVETHTKSSCPSVDAVVLRGGVPYQECTLWRNQVIDRINEVRPALVLIANYGRAHLADATANYSTAWERALESTLMRIGSVSAVIVDTPDLGQNPSVCLSANLANAMNCGAARSEALNAPSREAEEAAASTAGAEMIDMTGYLCGSSWCPPIIGNTLAYRDAHHITATYSAQLATVLGEQLIPLLGR